MDNVHVVIQTTDDGDQDESVELHDMLTKAMMSFASDHGLVVHGKKVDTLASNSIEAHYEICDEDEAAEYFEQKISTPEESERFIEDLSVRNKFRQGVWRG